MKGIGLLVALAIVTLAMGCACDCKAGTPEKVSKAVAEMASEVATNVTAAVVSGVATSPAMRKATSAVASAGAAVAAMSEKNKGWGAEVGSMLREAGVAFVDTADGTLNVTQDHLERFSKSDAGKFTMFAIAWKLLGEDVIKIGNQAMGYLIGIFLLIGLTKILWSTNRRMTVGQMIVVKKTGWGPFNTKTWEFREATVKDDELKGLIHLGTGIAQVVLIIVCCMIMA
jgi:hypothetical protein